MTTLAYCIYNEWQTGREGWVRFCPDCWLDQRKGYNNKADAEVTGLNGDTISCDGCGKEIR